MVFDFTVETPKSKYDLCIVDADTILYQAAALLQENSILVTHKQSGRKKKFKGVKDFYGLGKSKDKGWIGQQNALRKEKGQPLLSVDDFDIEQTAELKDAPPGMTLLEYGLQTIDFKVGDIKRVMDAESYQLYIGGSGNFRFDAAHILPYKGQRTDKPLMFKELRDAFLDKYRSKVVVARNGLEADDEVSIKGWESYRHFLKTGEHKYILSYVDKDLKSIPCPYFNYMKIEEGITYPTIEDCARHFCIQLLCGDKSTDNIQGLPNISKEFASKYNVTQRGIGFATAEKILSGCTTPKEMYSTVVEAYKSYYGEDEFEFTSFRGEKSMRTWLDMLRENAILLYMCRTYDEAGNWDIAVTLNRMGVI